MPSLSIVIVNWNTRDMLLDALSSIYQHPPNHPMQVIVVDNASTDGSAQAVAQQFPQVELIASPHNTGYAEGNNIGIQRAHGDFLLLLNPDVLLPPNGLQTALHTASQEHNLGALGVKLVNPDGTTQRSVRGFPTPFAVLCEALGISRIFPNSRKLAAYRMPWFNYTQPAEVDQPMGTFLLIPKTALQKVGLLDQQFRIFFNEVDWCYRAKQAGLRILYSPKVEVVHYGGGGTSQAAPQMAWESRDGLLRFYRKHYPSLLFAPVYWITVITSWIHAWWTARRRRAAR